MAAARATLIREIGDLREQYLDLLELVEERTLHDPQPLVFPFDIQVFWLFQTENPGNRWWLEPPPPGTGEGGGL